MNKTYDPQSIEQQLYKHWESSGYFEPSADQGQTHYSIVIPPPNVTGNLHMGHAFQNALMDILIRYQRMQGKRTLWMPGTDHAGIATQIVVERQLEAENTTRHALGRDKFTDRIWQWKEESGGNITQQMRRLGASLDWSRERFTMDEGFSRAVMDVFIQLYREDLIYKGKRLVNWDPKLNTSVSDLEVVNQEEPGFMWHFQYPIIDPVEGSRHFITIATTRPETMFGDAAIAVHPADTRYASLIGCFVQLPICDRPIPIIADDYVDPEFGTGCVKITPAHDFNDFAVGQRHELPLIEILNLDATLNDNVPKSFQGLDRYVARDQVVSQMDALGLLVKTEPHTLKTPRGERTGAAIEPILTSQWFVRAKVLAEPAIEAVKNGDIEFVPKNWENTYFSWMNNIEDWCISRQLWWGHRIPAWYDEQNHVYVGHTEAEIRQYYNLEKSVQLHQDDDVLDTWFSSALWSFGTLGWPEPTDDLAQFHPTNVLVTGFDIIFFWVARMIMLTLKFRKQVPFKTVYMHGLIRDSEGQKMSKSKGNVLDPIDLIDGIELEALVQKRTAHLMKPNEAKKIEKATRKEFPAGINAYGTDALRFTFCALASTGRDIRFDTGRIEGYRNFCNKLWNASRFVHMTCLAPDMPALPRDHLMVLTSTQNIANRWILNQLQDAIHKAHTAYDSYRFDLLAQTLYQFAWHEFCDWYLELAKITLYKKLPADATPQDLSDLQIQQKATRLACVYVLDQLMRLLHPIMPYITESIWKTLQPHLHQHDKVTIMTAQYPQVNDQFKDEASTQTMSWTQDMIAGLRTIRGEMNIPHSIKIPVLLTGGTTTDRQLAANGDELIRALAQADSIHWLEQDQDKPIAASLIIGDLQVLVPLAGLIDVAQEQARVSKTIEKLQAELSKAQAQIQNEKFCANAPEPVVQAVKLTIEDASTKIKHYQNQQQELRQLES